MKRVVPFLLALPLLLAAAPSHAQSAVDERAIIATASALDAAIDDKDWELARSLLLDEVTVALPGEKPGTVPADALVARWKEVLHLDKTTFHLRGGERVIFDGADSAVLRSKAQVSTRVDGIAGDDLHELHSDYHHELDRTENGWRVRHYGYVPRLESGNVAVVEHRLAVEPDADAPAAEDAESAGAAAGGEGEGAADGTAGDATPSAGEGEVAPDGAAKATPDAEDGDVADGTAPASGD